MSWQSTSVLCMWKVCTTVLMVIIFGIEMNRYDS
jgi:hypothetical protein